MDHAYIEQADLRSRYVLRGLSTDEERAFEEHLVACAECQDAVESEISLREGLRELAASDVLRPASQAPSPRARWVAPLLAVAASLLLVASATLAVQLRRVAGQRDRATADSADARQRQLDAERSAAGLAARLAASDRQSPGDRGAQAAVFALTITRGAAAPGDETAANRIRLDGARWIVLAIDLAKPAGSAHFVATITDAERRSVVWTGGPFDAGTPDTLTLALDAALFHPGSFVLNVERQGADGRAMPEGRYSFRVVAPGR